MSDLGDHHRFFLQFLMWKKICKSKEVFELYRQCLSMCDMEIPENINPIELSQFVNKINSYIRPIHMEIRKGIDEDTGMNYYALINITNSSVSCLSSDYDVIELEFLKKIIDKIVMSEDGVASSVALLNLTDELERKISKKDAEDLIDRFVIDKLLQEKNGSISFSVRSMIELDPYFRQIYSEAIIICPMCNQIVLKGQSCDECDVKLHLHCAIRYFREKEEFKCPRCPSGFIMQWTHNMHKQGMQPVVSTSKRGRN